MFVADVRKLENIMPMLKARAAEVKNFGRALFPICENLLDMGVPANKIIVQGLKASCEMDALLDAHPHQVYPALPPAAQSKFAAAGYLYLKCQNFLANHFNTQPVPRMLFNVTVKSHYLVHILLQSKEMNPRSAWCFAGERNMYNCRVLEAACVNGTQYLNSSNDFSRKYAVFMHSKAKMDSESMLKC
eukprot:730898-Karenia_brevis.AAC.1